MSLEVRESDLSGAFWHYNQQIDSISDVIYFIFPFNFNPTSPLICLFSVHLVIFVVAKFLLCRMKKNNSLFNLRRVFVCYYWGQGLVSRELGDHKRVLMLQIVLRQNLNSFSALCALWRRRGGALLPTHTVPGALQGAAPSTKPAPGKASSS